MYEIGNGLWRFEFIKMKIATNETKFDTKEDSRFSTTTGIQIENGNGLFSNNRE